METAAAAAAARDHGSPARANTRPAPSPRTLQPLRLTPVMPQQQQLSHNGPSGTRLLSSSGGGSDATSPLLSSKSPALTFVLNHSTPTLALPQSMMLSGRSLSAQQLSPDLTTRTQQQQQATTASSLTSASASPNPSPQSLSHSNSATMLSPLIGPRKFPASLPGQRRPSDPAGVMQLQMLEQSKMHELSAMQASLVAAAHEQPKSSEESGPSSSLKNSASTSTFLALPPIGISSGSAERSPEASPVSSSPSNHCGSAPREKRFSFSQQSAFSAVPAGQGKPPAASPLRGRASSVTSLASTTAAPSAASSVSASRVSSAVPSPAAATAVITSEILAKFGPLLGFFQSPLCRFFSRCGHPVPIFQRDLAALCKGYSEPLPILRALEALNHSGAKFSDFKSLLKAVRRVLKKQAISQLVGNGGALDAVFEDASLLEGQAFSSPLIVSDAAVSSSGSSSVSVHRCAPPLDSELDALFDCVGGSLQRLSQVFIFFLLEESPPRNAFANVAELVCATRMVLEGQELGSLGQRQPLMQRPSTASEEHDASYDSGQMQPPALDDSTSSLLRSLSVSQDQDHSNLQPSPGADSAPVVSPLAAQ